MRDSPPFALTNVILNNNIKPCDVNAFMSYLTMFDLNKELILVIFQLSFWYTYSNSFNHILTL